MKKQFQNDNGMTLVEILATLVLLSIVLLAFFSFFTQSAKFTQHNKEKLTAVGVAEEVVATVRDWNIIGNWECDKDLKDLIVDEKWKCKNDSENDKSKGIIANSNYDGYNVEIEIIDGPNELPLKKAEIRVTSSFEKGIKNSTFTTEMYFGGGSK